jgi:hypothetical protein
LRTNARTTKIKKGFVSLEARALLGGNLGMNGKALSAFVMANIFLWAAFSVTVYNFVSVALAGGLFSQFDYTVLGVLLVVCVVFSYLTYLGAKQ